MRKIKQLDWTVLVILVVFSAISTLLIYSATHASPDYSGLHLQNITYYALGFAVLLGAAFFDYRLVIKISPLLYGFGILLLVAVLLFGVERNGARSWFVIPKLGLNFQPAELAKLLLILFLAYMLARRKGEPLNVWKDIVLLGLLTALPFGLVFIQPDLGNAVIFVVIWIGMLWIGNLKYMHTIIGLIVAVGLLLAGYFLFQTYHESIEELARAHDKEHWVERIDTFLNPSEVSSDDSYQYRKSKIAIGSGALFGEGFLQGGSIQNSYIPYAYSDSIFVVVGEEFGFMGSSILLLLYFFLLYRLILICVQASTLGGSYLIIGIISMFVFQIFENIGMFLGLMPLTGITLPFVSYGGSSLLINMLSFGLALSVKVHRGTPEPY